MWIKVSCLWGSPNLRVAFCADDSFKTLWDYNINISSFAVFACYCQLLFSILWKHPQFIHTFYHSHVSVLVFLSLPLLPPPKFIQPKMQAFAKPMLSKTSPTNVRGMARTWPPWGGEIVERPKGYKNKTRNIEKTDTFWDDHPTWSQLNQNEAKIPHVLKNCFQIIKKSTPKTFPKSHFHRLSILPKLQTPRSGRSKQWNCARDSYRRQPKAPAPAARHNRLWSVVPNVEWTALGVASWESSCSTIFSNSAMVEMIKTRGWVWRRIWVSWAQFDQRKYCKAQENWLEDTALIHLRHWQVPNSVKIQKCRLQQHLIILSL